MLYTSRERRHMTTSYWSLGWILNGLKKKFQIFLGLNPKKCSYVLKTALGKIWLNLKHIQRQLNRVKDCIFYSKIEKRIILKLSIDIIFYNITHLITNLITCLSYCMLNQNVMKIQLLYQMQGILQEISGSPMQEKAKQ